MSNTSKSEAFAASSAAYMGRMKALNAAAQTERVLSLATSWGSYTIGIVAIIARWVPTVPALLAIVAAVVMLRAIGRGFMAAWSYREIKRIKAAWPLPAMPDDGQP